MQILANLNLLKSQLQNAVIHPLGTAPGSPVEGQFYYNSTGGTKQPYYWDGTTWQSMKGGTTDFPLLAPSDSAGAPSYSWSADPNTGIYNIGADQVGIATNGTLRTTISTTALTSTLPLLGPNGSASSPTFAPASDPNTGLYSVGADQLGFSTGGTSRLVLSTTELTSTLPILAPLGSTSNVSFAFGTDINTGLMSAGADQFSLIAGGNPILTVNATGFFISGGISTVSFGGQILTNVADPVGAQDGATKAYVDTNGSRDWKESVVTASTTNVTISNPGTSTIGGIALTSGDRVLLTGQTTPAQNGIYIFNGSGSAMTRAPDADTSAKVTTGMSVRVTGVGGVVEQGAVFYLSTGDPITLNTTSLSFLYIVTASTLRAASTITAGTTVRAGDNSFGTPTYTFSNDPDTGMYRVGDNEIGFTTNATHRLSLSTAALTSTLPILLPNGAAGTPAISFASDTNLGLFRIGTDNLGVAANGLTVLAINETAGISFEGTGGQGLNWSQDGSTLTSDGFGNINIHASGAMFVDVGTYATFGSRAVHSSYVPTDPTHLTNKLYVDGLSAGLKSSKVRAATTANITLSGAQTIDTVSVIAGDRVLVKNQSAPSTNGLYVAASGAWSRAPDMDTAGEVDGTYVIVEDGAQAGTFWITVSEVTTLGTDAITWTQWLDLSSLTAGNGITKTGNTIAVNLDSSGGLEFNGTAVRAKLDGATLTRSASGLKVTDNTYQPLDATLTALAALNTTAGLVVQTGTDTFTKRDLTGTSNRITITNGSGAAGAPTVDIASTYVGQATITTLGTITTGVWNGTDIAIADGGTGASTAPTARANLNAAGKYSSSTHSSGATIVITQATHGLASNGSLVVQVYEVSSGDVVYPEINVNNSNGTVTITFPSSVGANTYRVNITG